MPAYDLEKIRKTAQTAARAGGEILSRYYQDGIQQNRSGKQTIDSRAKEMLSTDADNQSMLPATYNLVTDADLDAEKKIGEVILAAFPDHAIMGEETYHADASAEHLWIVDPLDGTNNFAHGIPHFAVSIAYYHQGIPIVGIVFNPIRDDWFEAVKGGGATYNGNSVSTAKTDNLKECLIGVGFYYDRGEMMDATLNAIGDLFRAHIHGIRRMGTAALDLCQVGLGWYGGYFEYQLCPWDFAAGRLFVEEAGGIVTKCDGEPVEIAKTSMLATNGGIHQEVLGIIQQHYKPEFNRG